MTPHASPQTDAFANLAAYKPLSTAPDELIDESGAVRPAWRPFARYLAAQTAEEIAARIALGDQYLADSGVFFRHVDGNVTQERAWPLSHVPVLVAENEWNAIVAGLTHRADLLEAVMADLYGPNTLVAEGWLPPKLVAGNPTWLRPMIGVTPRSGRHLHFISFELGRAPNGQWWVLSDRTQAPSGAGFALENRVATSRVFADYFSHGNVLRLAGFFKAFREHLDDLRGGDSAPPALLTPGVNADTYFEHAYIARYLGMLLVEGEDLVIERGRPMVRTVSGLAPVDVLWRRIDSRFTDPLELEENSRIGAPGLIGALRQQGATIINPMGSGVLETRALMAFLPRISERLTGEPLRLPNIATWWCGQPEARARVLEALDDMTISHAFSTRLPFDPKDATAMGGALRATARDSMESLLNAHGENVVGQELVTLSTSPAWVDGALAPRPMILRVFLGRSRDGWIAMPGGYARIGRSNDVTALGMHEGGSCADVWVISDKPPRAQSMIMLSARSAARDQGLDLTSRTADNLFWLGRYVERTEFLARVTRAYDVRLTENPAGDSPLLGAIADYLRGLAADPQDAGLAGVSGAIHAAERCAARLRETVSPDALIAISLVARSMNDLPRGSVRAAHMGEVLRRMAAFAGLVHENMYRTLAWRFLSIGRGLERAMAIASMLTRFADEEAPPGALEAALECADSKLTHQRKFGFAISAETVMSLLCLDANNPRSLISLLAELKQHIEPLPRKAGADSVSDVLRTALQAHTDLAIRQPAEVDGVVLNALCARLGALSDQLTSAYFV